MNTREAPSGGGDMPEIKNLLEQQAAAFEEFKRTNDERLSALAAGQVTSHLEEKLAKIESDLQRLSRSMADYEKLAARPPSTGTGMISPIAAEHRSAWQRWVRKGDDTGLRELERKAMTIGSDPDGGYLAPSELEAAIDRLVAASAAMLRLATVRDITASSYQLLVRTSGAGYTWVGETEEPGETATPKYSQIEIVPGTIAAEPRVSQMALEDGAVSVEDEVLDALDQALTEGIGAAFITGNGVKKPRGVLAYDTVANSSWAWGKLGYVATGVSGAWPAANPSDKLLDTVHALKSGYRGGARWLMNELTLASIRKMKDGQGNYMWGVGLNGAAFGTLLGYPVETDDAMPDIAADSLSVAFGDFRRGYIVARRRGIAMLRDPYTAKPFVKFYTTLRVGGGVKNFEAVKLIKFGVS